MKRIEASYTSFLSGQPLLLVILFSIALVPFFMITVLTAGSISSLHGWSMQWFWFFFWPISVGGAVANRLTETLSSPASFLIPGFFVHIRKFLVKFAFSVSFVPSLLLLANPSIYSIELVIAQASFFFCFLSLFCSAVVIRFMPRLYTVLVMILVIGSYLGYTRFGTVIFLIYAMIFSVLSFYYYLCVTAPHNMRMFQRQKLGNGLATDFSAGLKTPYYHNWILSRISRSKSHAKYIIASLYEFWSQTRFVAFAAGAAIFGVMYLFMARREANYFLLIFSLLYLIRMNLPLYSSLLVSGGRKERFSNACACALLTYILGGIAYLTFLFSLKIVVHFINGYSIFGYTFAPCDFNLKVALIAFSFVPLLFIPQVFPGIFNFGIKFLVSAVLLGLVIGITVELSRNDSNTQNIVAFSSFILSWSALIGALYYHFTRRDLVSNANPSQPAANF